MSYKCVHLISDKYVDSALQALKCMTAFCSQTTAMSLGKLISNVTYSTKPTMSSDKSQWTSPVRKQAMPKLLLEFIGCNY